MKKINTIDYGGKVIGVGLLFLAVIPAALYGLNCLAGSRVIQVLLFVSLSVGALVEVGFGLVLLLELRQDRIINDFYASHPASERTPQQILDDRRWKRR